MNILNNRNKRTSIFKAVALCLIAAVSFTLVSCDDDMDIQQSYPFTVEVMPVPNKVTKGQTVEIRCELKKEGDFANTLYTIRYFQFEGEGKLKMDNGITFLPNDRYLLENGKTTSATPSSWNLTSTTGTSRMTASPSFPSETSNHCRNDACVVDDTLFASGGLFCVRADQPPRGNGRAGGNLPTAAFREGCALHEVF